MNWTTTVGDNNLGVLHMRSQTDLEQAFVNALTPREGFKLVIRRISPIEAEIACVADDEAGEQESVPLIDQSPSNEDYEVLAAQNGIEVKPTDRPIDIAHKVRKAKKRA